MDQGLERQKAWVPGNSTELGDSSAPRSAAPCPSGSESGLPDFLTEQQGVGFSFQLLETPPHIHRPSKHRIRLSLIKYTMYIDKEKGPVD